jgi:hypothetical protein
MARVVAVPALSVAVKGMTLLPCCSGAMSLLQAAVSRASTARLNILFVFITLFPFFIH